jgi:antirestriction protein ArdC
MTTIYQEITDSIIQELEKGATPWVKPWHAPMSADKNIVSGKAYRGINRLLLAMVSGIKGYTVPVWATYDQWQFLGAQVRKGEKAAKVIYFSQAKDKKAEASGEDKYYQFAKAFYIFNVAQVDGIDIIASEDQPVSDNQKIEACENRIIATQAKYSIGGDTACYIPSIDSIRMPALNTFQSAEHYYATFFHELTHWTSEKTRCDRDLSKGRFGNADYAFEELVAELGAAFLCQQHGIAGDLRHAGYIESWLKCLKSDSKAIFKASALAQQASDFLLACGQEKPELIDDELLAA